jgi:hypothetical protein
MNFIVSVSSQQSLDQLINRVAGQMGLTTWSLTHESEWPGYSINPHPSLPILASGWKDTIRSHGKLNELLREKLKTHSALFFACDWLIPYELSTDWLDKIKEAYARAGSLGSEIRSGEAKRTGQGYFTQRFAVRLYSAKELERLAKNFQGAELALWIPISEEAFSSTIPIAQNTSVSNAEEERLFIEVFKMSQINGEIHTQMGNQRGNEK